MNNFPVIVLDFETTGFSPQYGDSRKGDRQIILLIFAGIAT